MFNTALMATDLSVASDAMVRCADALRPLGVKRVVLFHALGLRHLQDAAPWLREQAEPRLAGQAAVLRGHGLEVVTEVAPGVASREIVNLARARDVPFIVMSATSDSVAREFLMGAVTNHVLHDAPCPVLVLHLKPQEEGTDRCEVVCSDLLNHVVFGTDFSDTAERAFKVLEELASLGARRVTLVHVQDRARIREDDRKRIEEFNATDRGRLNRLRDALLKRGAGEVEIEIPFGSPVRELVSMSEREDVTLVLLGTQGRGFFGERLLGGVAHQVARRASVPTLLVPPKAESAGGQEV